MFKQKLFRLFLVMAIQLQAPTIFAFALDEDIYYQHQGEAKLIVRSSLDFDEGFLLGLHDGDTLILMDQRIDHEGARWFRVGRETKASFISEDESVSDFWVREDSFAKLNVVEEILARVTYCYRYVKKYLLKKGFVDTYLPGASAYMAATILPKHGFSKVERKPAQAIKYDVCVYRGGPSGHGHIEVLDAQGWYYGYGYKKQPIQNRTFIGCFDKKLR